MTTRRGFLRLLGGVAVGGKKAATEIVASLSPGLSALAGREMAGGLTPESMDPDMWGHIPKGGKKLSATALKLLGIPEWQKAHWKQEAKSFRTFDPHIAAMRSWSLSAKVAHQASLNYIKCETQFWNDSDNSMARRAFTELYGGYDWWGHYPDD